MIRHVNTPIVSYCFNVQQIYHSLSSDILCMFLYLPSKAELKEGGKDIEVTFENREEYVRRPGMGE